MIKLIKRLLWHLQFSDPDPETFIRDLDSAQLGSYSRMQRYRDFRSVFLGTPAGKRVLWTLIKWAHVYKTNVGKDDPHMVYFREGERNIGLKVMNTMNVEPSIAQQTTTVDKEPD